jgi:hypothetical protein
MKEELITGTIRKMVDEYPDLAGWQGTTRWGRGVEGCNIQAANAKGYVVSYRLDDEANYIYCGANVNGRRSVC